MKKLEKTEVTHGGSKTRSNTDIVKHIMVDQG